MRVDENFTLYNVFLMISMFISSKSCSDIQSMKYGAETVHVRIEVHFFRLHLEMKGNWSRVNLVKRQDLHMTSVLSFPNANEKKCTSILIC